MKAWVLREHGPPEKAFRLEEATDPEPREHQVLLDIEGFGLNYADVMAARGLYREAPPLPSIIGYEVVGRVVGHGMDVPPDLMGKRVLALTRFGGYAEKACSDHRAVQPIPEDMPLGTALSLGTQGCTAWYMSRYAVRLLPGMRVLVHSAAGGVGQLLVQLALRSGCTVYAIAGGPEKRKHLKAMGAQYVIDRKAGDPYAQLAGLLGQERLDVSFNAVAGSTFKKDMRLLGSGGSVVLFGGAERSGSGTLAFVWRMGLILPIFLMMKSKSIIGVNMLKLGDHRPQLMARCLGEVVEAARNGELKPHVEAELLFSDLPRAHERLAAGGTMGKLAIRW
ncbi:MAG: zinc-binding dehydrogenase [Flavobacteriales bacterium]|nr:zinc-binding dehydrogenase [Flavobacteriales bacterium]